MHQSESCSYWREHNVPKSFFISSRESDKSCSEGFNRLIIDIDLNSGVAQTCNGRSRPWEKVKQGQYLNNHSWDEAIDLVWDGRSHMQAFDFAVWSRRRGDGRAAEALEARNNMRRRQLSESTWQVPRSPCLPQRINALNQKDRSLRASACVCTCWLADLRWVKLPPVSLLFLSNPERCLKISSASLSALQSESHLNFRWSRLSYCQLMIFW